MTITIGGEDHFDRFREANILRSIPEIVRNMSARTLIILLCCCKPSSSTENLSLNFGIDLDGPEDWSGTHTFTMDDLSFELETDVICLEPPKEDSPYKQAVLCQLAREKGAPLEQPADAKKLLHLIRDRRGDADNLTLSKVVSNALIRRKGTGPLTMKDFSYLSALFVSRKKPRRKSREKEMELVGQQAVRRLLEQIVDSMAFQARRRRLGLPADAIHYTFAFLGAPGTGKTTWARWLAKRMAEQKLLSDTSSICINAAELKAKYVGHTTAKVHALFEEYGVIILDEAYSLIEGDGGDCFGAEALSQLCVELENHGSDRLVIFAGYGGSGNPEDNRMLRFLQSNPGINSRISFKIHFQDFRPGELVQVLHTMLTFDGYRLPEGTDPLAEDFFRRGLRRRAFGNCREVRNLADRIKIYTAARLAQVKPCTREMASQILLPDVEAAIQEITEEYDGLDRNQGRPVGFS